MREEDSWKGGREVGWGGGGQGWKNGGLGGGQRGEEEGGDYSLASADSDVKL